MCELSAVGWVMPDEEIWTRYGLRVLRLNVFRQHCGMLMAVTELVDICRNPRCRAWVTR